MVERLAEVLPPDEYQQIAGLIAGGGADLAGLVDKVASHLRFLEEAADNDEFVEIELGRAVAGVLQQLIAGIDELAEEAQQLVVAAVEYFVLASDVDDDVRSPIGLEDDVRVVNAVTTVLGREDLRI